MNRTSDVSHLAVLRTFCIVIACAATGLARNAPAPQPTVYAKTIFYNGTVVTVNRDPTRAVAEALAVAPDGTILAVGNLFPVLRTQDPSGSTTLIDLHGRTLLPGFVEPHTHVIQTAFTTGTRLMTNLSSFGGPMNPGTIKEIQDKLRAASPSVKGGWLLGWGVDPSRSIPFMASLDAKTLDEVPTTLPIFVLNQSGHVAYVNTAAIKAAAPQIPNEPTLCADPLGGRYERKKIASPPRRIHAAASPACSVSRRLTGCFRISSRRRLSTHLPRAGCRMH